MRHLSAYALPRRSAMLPPVFPFFSPTHELFGSLFVDVIRGSSSEESLCLGAGLPRVSAAAMEQRVVELEALVRGVEDEFARACARQSTRLAAVEERLGRASAQVTPERSALWRDCQRPGAPLLGVDIHVDAHGRAALQLVPQPHGGRAGEDEEQPATHAHLVATIHALRTELQAKDTVIQALRARANGGADGGGGAGRKEEEEESDDEIDPDVEVLPRAEPRYRDADAGDEVHSLMCGSATAPCSALSRTQNLTRAHTRAHTRTYTHTPSMKRSCGLIVFYFYDHVLQTFHTNRQRHT